MSRVCHKCQKETDLSQCSRCKRTYYCSKECQVADWDDHKVLCRMNVDMKENAADSTPEILRWSKVLKRLIASSASAAFSMLAWAALQDDERSDDEVVVVTADFGKPTAFVESADAIDGSHLPAMFPSDASVLEKMKAVRRYANSTYGHLDNMFVLFIVQCPDTQHTLCEVFSFALTEEPKQRVTKADVGTYIKEVNRRVSMVSLEPRS